MKRFIILTDEEGTNLVIHADNIAAIEEIASSETRHRTAVYTTTGILAFGTESYEDVLREYSEKCSPGNLMLGLESDASTARVSINLMKVPLFLDMVDGDKKLNETGFYFADVARRKLYVKGDAAETCRKWCRLVDSRAEA